MARILASQSEQTFRTPTRSTSTELAAISTSNWPARPAARRILPIRLRSTRTEARALAHPRSAPSARGGSFDGGSDAQSSATTLYVNRTEPLRIGMLLDS